MLAPLLLKKEGNSSKHDLFMVQGFALGVVVSSLRTRWKTRPLGNAQNLKNTKSWVNGQKVG
jgi:hypothetical protein